MEFVNDSEPSVEAKSTTTTSGNEKEVTNSKKPLVVRVKRKRCQEALDVICVEEQNRVSKKRGLEGVTEGLNSLTYVDSTKILLKRIDTVTESGADNETSAISNANSLDSSTFNALKRYRGADDSSEGILPLKPKRNRDDFKLIVTKNKKVFTSEENNTESMVFVDMDRIAPSSLRQGKEKTSLNDSKVLPRRGKRILDPLTRMLDASIAKALATGDFTDMMTAIDQGADINYQRTDSDGQTCLMTAVRMSNLTVVSKLLSKNANVLLQNELTQTAVDIAEYAKLESKNHAASKILIMVRHLASEQYMQLEKSNFLSGSGEDDNIGGEYVYDIYTCDNTSHHGGVNINGDNKQEKNSFYDTVPNVKVSGLSLDDMGNAEIDFQYDSDWSDMANDDDEDDSNDENYFGNDYPEDEDSNDGFPRNYDKMLPPSDEEGDFDDYDSEEECGRLPRFDRAGVGRQLKPFVVGENQSSFGKTSEEIEKLWSLRDSDGDDMRDGIEQQHAMRLDDMGKRTGSNRIIHLCVI